MNHLEKLVTIILVGGLGSKLGPSEKPKCLKDIGTMPLIQKVLNYSNISSISQKIIISAGYLGEQIKEFFQDTIVFSMCPIEIDVEYTPLGTGGSLDRLFKRYGLSSALVMNGDVLLKAKSDVFKDFYSSVLDTYHDFSVQGLFSVTPIPDTHWMYVVESDSENRILSFQKNYDSNEGGVVNIGMYWIRRELLQKYSYLKSDDGKCSLERNIIPAALKDGIRLKSYLFQPSIFMDMTTQEDFDLVKKNIKKITRKIE